MNNILLVGGASAYRNANIELKRRYDLIGIHTKRIRKKDKDGNIRGEYVYYYRKVPRTKEEQAVERAKNKGKYQTDVRYKDVFIGKEPPDDYEVTILQEWLDNGRVVLDGKDVLTEPSIADFLFEEFPHLFEQVKQFTITEEEN